MSIVTIVPTEIKAKNLKKKKKSFTQYFLEFTKNLKCNT